MQQNDILLREVVFILLTTREIVRRLFLKEKQLDKLSEVGQVLICQISTETVDKNMVGLNYTKLMV